MDCTGVAGHLVAYHFATVSDEERDAIDAHLLGCTTCLASYLALKRATDKSPPERPRAAVKARLRAEVASAFPERVQPSARVRLLARRIPLYQGLFAAAAAAAIALVVPRLVRGERQRDVSGANGPSEGAAQIDSARPRAESFQIY
jgi:anti-sigma factor RsiW